MLVASADFGYWLYNLGTITITILICFDLILKYSRCATFVSKVMPRYFGNETLDDVQMKLLNILWNK